MKKNFNFKFMLLLFALVVGISSVWATDVTYTFTSKNWESANGNWSGDAGSQMDPKGVQCLKNVTYTVTSPSSLSNISSIVVTYGTAKNTTTSSKISIQVGSNSAIEKNVTGGSLSGATLEWTYNTTQTGSIEMKVTAAGASVYIQSVKVTYTSGGGNSAPVWSDLPTPTIDVNEEYELDLSTYVEGTPTPTISLSTTVPSSLYEFEDGFLDFQPTSGGTYEFTFTAENSEGSANATLTVTAVVTATYTRVTSIESGRHYIITNGSTLAMGSQGKNNRPAATIALSGTTATVSSNDVYDFVIIGPDIDGYYTIYDERNEGYLYAASSSDNYLRTQSTNTNNGRWTISINNDNTDDNYGKATIVAQGSFTRNTMRFNSTLFSCYSGTSTVGNLPYLYAKDNESTISPTLGIAGCATAGTKAGYYLIASPVGQVTPTADNNFLDNNYDLYRFNQSGVNGEWENWKAEGPHNHFNLVSGRGYLYANSADVTLTFEGYQYVGNGQVFLSYDEDATFAGWNLIGNPWNQLATVGCAYYKMNNQGTDLEVAMASDPVAAMQGIFVHASTTGDNVTFTKLAKGSAKSAESHIALNIIDKNNNVIDCAIVCFDEGGTLPKFMLDENNTKIYIPQDDSRYAVVQSEGKGTMPVNFKAKQMGKYTISVNTEGIDMDYLHLIDRLTGEDVNLLLDNSYSFIASAQDVESRFILSFTASGYNQDADEPFAFQNGSDIIVNGTGELQIFDLMGRMVSTQNVNGIETINVKSQGVYIFRLNEKTQKIVVR